MSFARRSSCCSSCAATSRSLPRRSTANGPWSSARCTSRTSILLDYRLPGLDGVQIARLVRDECPEVAVVVLTAAAREREVEALLEQGAVACVGKDEPLDVIVEAIRRAASVETG